MFRADGQHHCRRRSGLRQDSDVAKMPKPILNSQLSTLTQGVAIGLDLFKPLQGISGGYQFSIPNSQFSTPPTLLVFSFYLLLYHNFSIQNDFMCYDALGRMETQEVVAAGKGADVDFGRVAVDLARQHGLARSIDQFGHALAFHTAYGQSA